MRWCLLDELSDGEEKSFGRRTRQGVKYGLRLPKSCSAARPAPALPKAVALEPKCEFGRRLRFGPRIVTACQCIVPICIALSASLPIVSGALEGEEDKGRKAKATGLFGQAARTVRSSTRPKLKRAKQKLSVEQTRTTICDCHFYLLLTTLPTSIADFLT